MPMLRFPADDMHYEDYHVVAPIALEAYYEAFAALCKEFPECWHLCQQAEDRCRAEHLPRVARKLANGLGRTPSWGEVFVAAAEDSNYWDRTVRRPAVGFLARGKRPASRPDPNDRVSDTRSSEPPAKKTKAAKQREKETRKAVAQATKHPKKDHQGRFTTTADGTEICYKFANGDHQACPAPCPRGRAHVCQRCLEPHSNRQCKKA